jgi:hypothetical protein
MAVSAEANTIDYIEQATFIKFILDVRRPAVGCFVSYCSVLYFPSLLRFTAWHIC